MARSVLGIDLGHSEAKLVELRRGRRGTTLERAVRVPLPVGCLQGGRIADRAGLREALHRELPALRVERVHTVVGLKSPEISVRTLNLPLMPPAEIREALRWEVAELLQLSPEEREKLVVDYDTLQEEGGQVRLGVVVTRRELVEEVIRLLREVRLAPEILDVNGFALPHALARPGRIAYVDIGAAYTEIYVVKAGTYDLYRLLPWGMEGLTDAVAAAFSLSREEAAARRRKDDLNRLLEDSAGRGPLQVTVTSLLGSLLQTLEYLRSRERKARLDEAIDAVVLAGGGALQKGMSELLAQELGCPVEVGDPLVDLAPADARSGEGDRPVFAAAVGLALRGVAEL